MDLVISSGLKVAPQLPHPRPHIERQDDYRSGRGSRCVRVVVFVALVPIIQKSDNHACIASLRETL